MSTKLSQSEILLVISDLCYAYPLINKSKLTIKNVSLRLKTHEIIAILGASGCGKSTLLNLIAGLLLPQSGKIQLKDNGKIVQKSKQQKIGYIFQQDTLLPWRTIESNLMLVTDIKKNTSKETLTQLMDKYLKNFHLDKNILSLYPAQLSGGMRQRINIIQTLMFEPEILLLDEPFSALDFFTKLRLEDEVHQLIKEQNKAAILITHDIDEAIAVADRIIIMTEDGQLGEEFIIDFGQADRKPEEVRGTERFAQHYHNIWSQLRSVIEK